jgi:hypothetical protein
VAKPHWVGQFLHAADAIGSDPYPIPFQPASLAADYTRETLRQVEGARAVWMIPQAFNWVHAASPAEPHRRNGRMPSFEEMRSMAWQCICHGATGLVFYEWWGLTRDPVVSFDTSWTALKRIAAEIDALAPAILSSESPPEVSVRAGEWLHWMVRLHGGKLYLVAASDGRGHGKATFRLPRPPGRIEVRGEDRSIAARAESFADTFAPRAVHVYEMDWPPK